MSRSNSLYLNKVIIDKYRINIIDKALKVLKPFEDKFDSIAFRGMSGATIAPILAHLLHKNLIICRKNKKECHSKIKVEQPLTYKKYLIVDDFVYTGDTIKNIIKDIDCNLKLFGLYLYDSRGRERKRDVENLFYLKFNKGLFLYGESK